MALALDASTPAFKSVAATAVTSNAFTPPSGSVLVAVAWHDTASGNTTNTSAVTDSQGNVWTIVRTRNRADVGGQNGHLQVSWAVPSSSSMTVTSTGTNTDAFAAIKVLVFTGADTSNPIDTSDEGSVNSNVVSMTLTTNTDEAWAWICNIDWNTAAIPTPGTGVTTEVGAQPGLPNFTVWLAKRNTVTSPAGSVTVNSTAPSTGNTNNYIAFAIKPGAGSGSTPSGTDTFTLAESASVMVDLPGATDMFTLTDTADVSVDAGNATDDFTFTDVADVVVNVTASDTFTLLESALQVPAVNLISASDSFTLIEIASNPNPSGRSGMTTLTYHLNRLAGTLVGGVPSLTAVDAANKWAGTSKLTLEDALNEKAGDSIPALDVAGALNKIAGTNDLTPVDAISRIP